ncbi:MAG: hypothetical protein RIT19_2986 [Verrucomicrobiota bacterium]|jgi:hypothetical protein
MIGVPGAFTRDFQTGAAEGIPLASRAVRD